MKVNTPTPTLQHSHATMFELNNKRVLVIGLDASGRAACSLLRDKGAQVTAVDSSDTPKLRTAVSPLLGKKGINLKLGITTLPVKLFDFAVVSPDVPLNNMLLQSARRRSLQILSELELGYQQSLCLNISVTGSNGKTTTTELIERILTHCDRKTVTAGYSRTPICAVAGQAKDLDYLTLEVSPFQLENIHFFRPLVGVLLNISPDHLNRYSSFADYTRAKAALFKNQQAFDWAIVQSEALAHLRSLNVPIPSKVLTFSAKSRQADIYLDRGLLISALPNWAGPLYDMDQGNLRGPYYAESIMAALAVGHVLRLPLDPMVEAVKGYTLRPHRVEEIAEINGVKYINDSKSTNLGGLHRALLSIADQKRGEPNVWLIAGGKDKGLDYHDIGPLLSQRVKGAFLIGETREKIRAAWSLFTPCTLSDSLLEAVQEAAKHAVAGDIVLFSPACSSYDQFQDYQHRGEVYRETVQNLAGSTGSGIPDAAYHKFGTGEKKSEPG